MILFFGPAGAGKSVQGQMLAARHGWRWISAGQLLRDTHDLEILQTINSGSMIDSGRMNIIVGEALSRAGDIDHLILDGFPREMSQAKWLVESIPNHQRSISLAIVLEVPREELEKRLSLRGRPDDQPDAIEKRLQVYRQEIYPILTYLTEENIPIAHIDGEGSIGQVHDKIQAEIGAILDAA